MFAAELNNEDRAESVAPLIDEFARIMGLENEDPVTKAGDLICNILHWVQQSSDEDDQRLDALRAIRSGICHYVTEASIDYTLDEVDPIGPDAWLSLTVRCDGVEWQARPTADPVII